MRPERLFSTTSQSDGVGFFAMESTRFLIPWRMIGRKCDMSFPMGASSALSVVPITRIEAFTGAPMKPSLNCRRGCGNEPRGAEI